MTIEVMKFKEYRSGSLIGFFDLWVPKMGLEIFGCSMHKKGAQTWINLPSREWKDDSGETKYLSIMRLRNEEHFKAFKKAALDAALQYCSVNNINLSGAPQPAAASQASVDAPPSADWSSGEDEGLPF